MIELNDVSYTYAKGTPFEKTALFNVSMKIEAGEFVAIAGSTGSGKSTLVQVMAGLLRAEGVTSTGRIGLVLQRPEDQLFEETVADEIAFAPRNFGCSEEEVQRRIDEAMKHVGLPEEYRSVSPLQLSGGERRRAAIAGILSMKPDVLILDEPTAGLDARSKNRLLRELKRLNDGGTTLVTVTHDMNAIAGLARRLIVMSKGRVLIDGEPRGVFRQSELLKRAGLKPPSAMEILDRLQLDGEALNVDECEAVIRKCFGI